MANQASAGGSPAAQKNNASLLKSWPAILLTIGMVAAAIYSFSPRSYPKFAPTTVQPDGFLADSIATRNGHYIAVGERGVILHAQSPEGPWQAATVDKERGSSLTRVHYVADNTAIAVGHDSWIIRSTDNGKTWTEIQFNADSSDPLLDIGGPYNGKLFAVGSFGQFEVSQDLGKTWEKQSVVIAEAPVETPAEPGSDDNASEGDLAAESDSAASDVTDPESDDYDPFAAFSEGGGAQNSATLHLNGIAQAADGSLFIVGERGLLLRSTDQGQTWMELDEIYDGSFYGAVTTPNQGLLVYGMRGNAFTTQDNGQTWQQSQIPVEQGLFQGAVHDGKVILVGASSTVLTSSDNGATFKLAYAKGQGGLVSVIPLKAGKWLTAGEGGIAVIDPNKKKNSPPANRDGDPS